MEKKEIINSLEMISLNEQEKNLENLINDFDSNENEEEKK
jgi:hypothetical protein